MGGQVELDASRLRARSGHYMPVSLLDSQFATLEPPADWETPFITLDAMAPVQ